MLVNCGRGGAGRGLQFLLGPICVDQCSCDSGMLGIQGLRLTILWPQSILLGWSEGFDTLTVL